MPIKDLGMKLATNPALNPIGYGINKLGESMKKDQRIKEQQQAQNITTGRGATNLFHDEQEKYDSMISDGLDDVTARGLISQKRKKMLADITKEEGDTLLRMKDDGLDSEKAVEVLKKIRHKNLPLWKKALKVPFDASVGATSLVTEQVGNVGDFVTGGQVPYFKEQVEGVKDVTSRSFEGQPGFQTGRNIIGAGEMFAVGPTKAAPTMGGRALQGAVTLGAIGAAEPILEKGSDVTPGEILKGGAKGAVLGAVATPILEKAVLPIISKTIQKGLKYGKAGVKGGFEGATKSVARDIKRPFTKIKLEGLSPIKSAKLSTKANRFNAKDIEDFQRITKTKANPLGETPGEFATRRGMTKVGDEAVEETARLWKASMKEADDAIALIDGRFRIKKGTDYMGEMLDDLSGRLGKTLSKDSKKVNLLLKKYSQGGLTQTEINTAKRLYAKNYKYTWVDAGSESALRSKNLQDGVREWQFSTAKGEGLTNLREINKTTQGWKQFSDSLAKKLKRSSGNNNISLTDWVALSGGEPTNIALFLGKKAGELTPIKRGLIKGLSKQTKPEIIKASRLNILKSNIKKRGTSIDRILSDRVSGRSTPLIKKPKPLALPQKASAGEPIITPQTVEKAIIQESKKGLEKTKFGINKPYSNKKAFIKIPEFKSPKTNIKDTPYFKDIQKLQNNINEYTEAEFAKKMNALIKKAEGYHIKPYSNLRASVRGGPTDPISQIVGDLFSALGAPFRKGAGNLAKGASKGLGVGSGGGSRVSIPASYGKKTAPLTGQAAKESSKQASLAEIKKGLDSAIKISEKSSKIMPNARVISPIEKIKKIGSIKGSNDVSKVVTDTPINKAIQKLTKNINNMTEKEFTQKMRELFQKAAFKSDIKTIVKRIVKLYVTSESGYKWSERDKIAKKIMDMITVPESKGIGTVRG